MNKKIRLALIFGGTSSEREVSISGAESILEELDKSKYEIFSFDAKYDLAKIIEKKDEIDTAFVLLHGENGEDGRIQGMLDLLGIPYQCSGILASALAMNKAMTKKIYRINGIDTPSELSFKTFNNQIKKNIIKNIGLPVIIKPCTGGSSISLFMIENEIEIEDACINALKECKKAMAEEYIKGIEVTCGVIGNSLLSPLPVIEICPEPNHKFFDYEAKYKSGETKEICPAKIDPTLTEKVQAIAVKAHKALGCKGYSRTDMIIKNNRIMVLETNTIPGMTKNSLLPLAAKTAGISFSNLLDTLIELSME